MKVYALVGESGSGKSHRAAQIAFQYGIHYVIDDGLLINDRKKIAGHSAKREKTKVMAVKRAIFFQEDHRNEVRAALEKEKPDKILILGTSDKMIARIAKALGIPEPDKTVYIREVSTEEEITLAKKMRHEFGQHVIPLPQIEVQRDFPFYWLNPLYSLIKRKNTKETVEKTIVRPHFSNLGKLVISENVILQIMKEEKKNYPSLRKITKEVIRIEEDGVDIYVELRVKILQDLPRELFNFKHMIGKSIIENTGLQVKKLKIEITSIDFQ